MLLLDDPLINPRQTVKNADRGRRNHRGPSARPTKRCVTSKRRFERKRRKTVRTIREESGCRMERQFEERRREEDVRREKRRQRDEERARLKKQEDEERAARLARLEEVKNQRLEHEKRKKDEEKRVEEKKLAAIKANRRLLLKRKRSMLLWSFENMTRACCPRGKGYLPVEARRSRTRKIRSLVW